MSDLLSQDEIDALLNGVDSGQVEVEAPPPPAPGEVRPYDLASEDRIAHTKLPGLALVNERFARTWRASLYNMVRTTVDVSVGGVDVVRLQDYFGGLKLPANLNMVHVKPFRGTAVFMCEASLVFAIVHHFFGGSGRSYTKIEGREFSPTEMRIVMLLLEQTFKDVVEAWSPILKGVEPEWVASEINPHFANIAGSRDYVVVSTFNVELEAGAGGKFQMVYPYSMLDPYRDVLERGMTRSPSEMDDEQWRRLLREQLQEAKLELSGLLGQRQMTLREVGQLKVGDIIPLKICDTETTLKVEHVPVYTGIFGEHNRQNSIKISRINTGRGHSYLDPDQTP